MKNRGGILRKEQIKQVVRGMGNEGPGKKGLTEMLSVGRSYWGTHNPITQAKNLKRRQ